MDKAALKKWAVVLGLGIVLWFCPVPAGLSPAWKLFAVFVPTIAGFILQPAPSPSCRSRYAPSSAF